MQSVRTVVPDLYRSWVRWAVTAGFLAYVASTTSVIAEFGVGRLYARQELYTLLATILALVLERVNRPRLAIGLTTVAVATEFLFTFATSGEGMASAPLPGIPVLVLVAGLFVGIRAAFAFAVFFTLGVPLAVVLGESLGWGAGLAAYDGLYISALAIASFCTAVLLQVFMRSFGLVLGRAELNERRAADLIASSPDGILAVAPGGRVEIANDLAKELLGADLDRLLDEHLDSSFRSGETRGSEAALDTSPLQLDPVLFHAKATGRFIEVRSRVMAGSDGRASQLLLIRDITQRIEAEQREAALATQLEHAQKLEAVGRLAGGVAHDFNNVLTAVSGYADFIEEFDAPDAPEIAAELRTTSQRGAALTRQLLAFARKDVPNPAPLDLAEVLTGARKLLGRVVGESVRLQVEAPQPCPIFADPGQLEHVLMNLAANARDAMPGGGTLKMTCAVADDEVTLEVRDNGCGMSPTVRDRIFDPFFTTKERGRGTGLGLSTVHGIVTRSGGRIGVESAAGEGSCFRLTWPRCEPACRDEAARESRRVRRLGRGLIVAAEDDGQLRRFVERVLTRAGFEVRVAPDGAAALSLVVNAEVAPVLIMSDVIMPGMSGVEFIKRARKHCPATPVLLTSGYTDDVLGPEEAGLREELLQKPFGREQLLDRVFEKLAPAPTAGGPRLSAEAGSIRQARALPGRADSDPVLE
jgi:two-component system cell cycle sensor histidine kinase/response regulator CckA